MVILERQGTKGGTEHKTYPCSKWAPGHHGGGKATSTKTHHSRMCFRVRTGGPGGGNFEHKDTRRFVLEVGVEVAERPRAQNHAHLSMLSCSLKWASAVMVEGKALTI